MIKGHDKIFLIRKTNKILESIMQVLLYKPPVPVLNLSIPNWNMQNIEKEKRNIVMGMHSDLFSDRRFHLTCHRSEPNKRV